MKSTQIISTNFTSLNKKNLFIKMVIISATSATFANNLKMEKLSLQFLHSFVKK